MMSDLSDQSDLSDLSDLSDRSMLCSVIHALVAPPSAAPRAVARSGDLWYFVPGGER